jgi:hypothetical protein
MKVEAKSAAILLTTLVLGIILGLVSQGTFQRLREQQVTAMRRPPGFVAHMEQVIEPTTKQDSVVRPVLERTALSNQQIIEAARAALRQNIDSMQRELTPVLNADQLDRLSKSSRLPDPFRPPPPRDGQRPPPRGNDDRRGETQGNGPPDDRPPRDDGRPPPRDGQRPPPPDGRGPPPQG